MAKRQDQEAFSAGYFRLLRNHRLVVRAAPPEAVRVAVGNLLAQGFAVFGDMETALRREESAWAATAVRIGQPSGFLRGMVNGLIEDTPLVLIPGLKRNIPPTLVVAAARWLPDGTCELLVRTQPSLNLKHLLVDHDDIWLAAPRIDAAVEATIAAFQGAGAFISDSWFTNLEPDCPAAPQRVKELTGWR